MHALSRNRSDLGPVLSTLLVGALLIAVIPPAPPPNLDACGPQQVAAQGEQNEQLGSQAIRVTVLSSLNKAGVMREMACRFEASGPALEGPSGPRPIDVIINQEASGAAYQSIRQTEPTVWSPAATSWVKMLRHDHEAWLPTADPPSIATSPQVIAVPAPIAATLGWPEQSLGWSDIIDFAEHPDVWLARTQDQWGPFKLAKTNPRLSTSGLNATVATFAIAADNTPSSDLTTEQIRDAHVLATVHAVESATVHYAPTSVDFLKNLRAQDDAGHGESYASAILLEEKSVWDYNHGNPSGDPMTLPDATPPSTQLVAFYPSDGAIVADHPYALLSAPWVTSDQRTAADRFLSFLLEPAQQARFQALGYRDANGNPGDQISTDNGLVPVQPNEMGVPDGPVLKTIRNTWRSYRKEARVLLVIDVSGSMSNPATSDSPATKLELAQAAALDALKQFAPTDRVGLWTFSPEAAQPAHTDVVPIRDMATNRERLKAAIKGLTVEPGNRSQLFTTVEDASASMYDHFNPDRINGIVLLSDGVNDGSLNTDEQEMLHKIAPRPQAPDEEVRIFTIAYGDSAERVLLTDIATSSLGTSYDATDAESIGRVFPQAVANF